MLRRHGFTLVELSAAIGAGALLASVAALNVQPDAKPGGLDALTRARQDARRLKDSVQVRGIGQAMIVWAQSNRDAFPLPSLIDKAGATVAGPDTAKDTSANIMSVLVYHGFVPTDMLVSPSETNPSIKMYEAYQFDRPPKAADPANAIWDPAFTVDFTGGSIGGLSYAHLQPSGGRKARWANTFGADQAVLSMRGPEITAAARHEDGSVKPTFANEKSLTFGMFDKQPNWSGNVAYNDNHVDYLAAVLAPGKLVPANPKGRNVRDAEGKLWPDLMFFDEPDDADSANDYLGIFIKAGETPKDFKAIWD